MELTDKHRQYWSKNLNLTSMLMVVWLVVTVLPIWFARELSSISIFGWPLPFYMASQGALIVYALLIWYYAKRMEALDHAFDVAEDA